MQVSKIIGLGTALLLALFTAILGGSIVRHQGMQTLMTAQRSLQRGVIPSKELFDGLCLIAAGMTLITPGFITDIIGFSLLIPAVRSFLRNKLAQSGKFTTTSYTEQYSDYSEHESRGQNDESYVIEAEYEDLDK